MARLLRGVAGALAFVVACGLVLGLIEGVARLLGGAPKNPRPPIHLAEARHTRYDPELGWSNVPGIHVADLYGPGRDLTVDSQGFRAGQNYAPRPPAGRVRALCVGDSFTLGYGVGDADPWCARLERLEPRLQTVNMGQGGYGVDQAYLWYRRDGAALHPDLVLFAFIEEDFRRMGEASFAGYPKPVLRLAPDGSLQVDNVPVPRSSKGRWLGRLARELDRLRVVQLARPELARLAPPQRVSREEMIALGAAVFGELKTLTRAQGAELVLIYLPMRWDYHRRKTSWRIPLAQEAARRGIPFIDLGDDLDKLPRSEVGGLYIHAGALDYTGAAGHYNEAGNAWAARALLARLRRLPGPAALLGAAPRREPATAAGAGR